MNVNQDSGLVIIANQQTQGRGRSGNNWISPRGCLMTSIPLTISRRSIIGSRLPLLVNITGLAVVKAVRSLEGYENIPLGIKWPNDIYYRDEIKLGGIILKSQTIGNNDPQIVVGCGLNVSNSNPTMCINDIIARFNNRTEGANLKPISVGRLAGLLYNNLETIISNIEKFGIGQFQREYYKYWIHSNKKVKIANRGNEDFSIAGINDYGFLCVTDRYGQKVTLQPDGNSFDLMRNLITLKN
ncbi:uncharacterized protein TRIADDRAFT_31020 [Trichoplax adhaerens]|uniref:BPL/LPL catalytic domain-containing protein n=1 Tax=Trichoplax adhaerens TaxID=10228 RepID=B3S8K6_TRIAD|nr:hypothetical protein TRIADDRAFT_31020 [Trichoplax adhaerens]EDV20900.1 hypothetical protein TRIADDRAFT_31020 [Trichoplax adhaerens]|eukprot:XP_002116544.1 hypothetical protein TRIADDRAFT_31020 [Trichoplax adhaerens]